MPRPPPALARRPECDPLPLPSAYTQLQSALLPLTPNLPQVRLKTQQRSVACGAAAQAPQLPESPLAASAPDPTPRTPPGASIPTPFCPGAPVAASLLRAA